MFHAGYVAIDGTSLTITSVDEDKLTFSVMLIQYTQNKIVLAKKKVGERVNLETDVLGKYFVKFMDAFQRKKLKADAATPLSKL